MGNKSTAKRKYAPKPPAELNLGPIMNLMVVLIPMLLYSAAFIKFGAVNVTKATGGKPKQVEKEPDEIPKPPLKLKVEVTDEGFVVKAAMILDEGRMIATPGDDGAAAAVELFTIERDEDLSADAVKSIEMIYKERKKAAPEELLEATRKVYSYDFKALNAKIAIVKKAVMQGDQAALAEGRIESGESQFEKSEQLVLALQGDIPYELMIKVMDAVRCKMLTPEEMKTRSEKIKELKKSKDGKIKDKNGYGCIIPLDAQNDDNANTYYSDVVLDAHLLD